MMFDESFLNDINKSEETEFKVEYLKGFPPGSEGFNKSYLAKYEVIYAKQDIIHIQLTFSNPLYVSTDII